MTSNQVRIGIVGPSWWVNYWHLPAIHNHPSATIVAICGERHREPDEVRARYGAAAYFTSLDDMLREAALDGVIVCTPNDVHYPATMAALRRGLHVTTEKPLALNAGQAAEMAFAARDRGLIGMTNFPYRDNPAVQAMHRMVRDGYLGTPVHVYGHYHGGYGLTGAPNWRASRARSVSGILGDLGSHLIDLARFVTCAEFDAVCAHQLTLYRPAGGPAQPIRSEDPRTGDRNDDSTAFLAEMTGGMQGIFHTSWSAYQGAGRQDQRLEAYGTEGRLLFTATHLGTQLLAMKTGDQRMEPVPLVGATPPEPENEEEEDYFRPGRNGPSNTTYRWIEAIRTGDRSLSPSLVDGLRAQEVTDAIIRASGARAWVNVERHEI